MSLLNHLLFRRRKALLAEKMRLYEAFGPDDIERLQVSRFNAVWKYCLEEVPFYRSWAREHGLPPEIGSSEELSSFPVLTKQVIVERSAEIFQNGALEKYVSTGGSTGEPAKFPISPSCMNDVWANLHLGRSWWGIRPFDRQVLLWGHSHLFGAGVRRHVAKAKRELFDYLINATRLDAYNMSDDALELYARRISAINPKQIVGYTSAIFRLARHIEGRGGFERPSKLKGIVLTAETVTEPDVEVIERVFQAPVIVEYGSAEAGAVAYSRGRFDDLKLFWDSFIAINHDGEIRLTTITRRLFPLINYAIGDRTKPITGGSETVLEFSGIEGRAQDTVSIPTLDGGELTLSAILLVHILKPQPGIRSVSFEQRERGLKIFVEADRELDLAKLADFFEREMRNDHPRYDASAVSFVQVAEQQKTLAGKHRLMRVPEEQL